jgi:hypothetical protein
VRFHNLRHPESMGTEEIVQFLSHLASRRRVSASTQNQALNAIVFLYRHVLDLPFPDLEQVVRSVAPGGYSSWGMKSCGERKNCSGE